jgi:hypothetical protein
MAARPVKGDPVPDIDYERLLGVTSQDDFDQLDDEHKEALRATASQDSDACLDVSAQVSDAADEQEEGASNA